MGLGGHGQITKRDSYFLRRQNFSQADMVQHCNQELSSDSTVVTRGFTHPTSLHGSVLITKAKELRTSWLHTEICAKTLTISEGYGSLNFLLAES